MEATYSSRILSYGLSCAHKLRTSNMKYRNSCFHHLQTLLVEESLVRQLCLLCSFVLTSTFCILRSTLSVPFRCMSASAYLMFFLFSFLWICSLFVSYWGPMQAAFSSWISPSELFAAHNLETARLKLTESCFHYWPTLFVEGSNIPQLCLLFSSSVQQILSFLDLSSLFYIARYRNLADLVSHWCLFGYISILLVSFWVSMEPIFSWILSNGLYCAHKLRVSNLKHKAPVSISCIQWSRKVALSNTYIDYFFIWITLSFFSEVLGLSCYFSNKLACWLIMTTKGVWQRDTGFC